MEARGGAPPPIIGRRRGAPQSASPSARKPRSGP